MPKAPITRFCNLSIEPNATNTENGLFAPNLSQIEINQISVNLPNINGAVVYNTTTAQFNFGVNGNFTPAGAGDVSGPGVGEAVVGHVPIFDNINGTVIIDGGIAAADIVEGTSGNGAVTINQAAIFADVNGRQIVNSVATFNPAPAQDILDAALEIEDFEPSNTTELGNIGYLQFDNAGTGGILVDSLVGMHLVINEVAVDDAQVCLIMGPGFGTGSTSVSALIELQTTTGALLLSRMTTTQRNALPQATNGMLLYNTTTQRFNLRENGIWVDCVSYIDGTLLVPSLTQTQRDAVTAQNGMLIYNTTVNEFNRYENGAWTDFGGVTSITAGTGLTGGIITDTGTIALANTNVTAGSYNNANITIDAQGRITAATNGDAGTVTSITAGAGLTGGVITTSGTIAIDDTAVIPGSYTYSSFTVNSRGQITAASSGTSPVTSVNDGTGIDVVGTTTPTINLTNTAVTPGSYTNSNITVDAQGRITTAASGTASGDVTGPGSSVNNHITTFSGTTGKIIQDSGILISDVYYPGNPTHLIDTYGTTDNFFVGTNIATSATVESCIGIGSDILQNAIGGPVTASNIAIGNSILENATQASNNTIIGFGSQRVATTAGQNVSVGNLTLATNLAGNYNAIVGTYAGQFIEGSKNVALGYSAMNGVSTSVVDTPTECVAIGHKAMLNVGASTGAIAIGHESQRDAVASVYNITIGWRSGRLLTSSSHNIAIGNNAAVQTTTGSENTIAGAGSFTSNVTGNNCVILGAAAGNTSTLDNNIVIGYAADVGGAFTNAVAIGPLTIAGISNSMVLGNGLNVGIGNFAPTYALQLGSDGGQTPLLYIEASGTITPPAVADDGIYMVIAGRPYFTSGNGNTGYMVTTITTGSNATAGLSTLNGITGVVVSTASVLADSKIHVTRHNGTGAPSFLNQGHISTGSIVPGVSFTIYSSNALDTEGVSWTMQP